MSSQEVSKKQSQEVDNSQSGAWQTTKETVSSATASLGGAFNFSGGLNANAGTYNKKTTTSSAGGQKMSKAETDQAYEERMADEYAKREGGA
ncbi:hypothetical protein LTS08_005844 [Lithohypha guttulata]|uniref:uncharacterized protein n=1 Tax=Lithohypha guttulata TaxID=1690604 RepID=UPI002DDE340D|nr:hypothetical protein LTR51_002357 [Lithohypha guttulata]KAK5099263.1 hypothetical protein LTS08_005844 [Lithohypha guttulata]